MGCVWWGVWCLRKAEQVPTSSARLWHENPGVCGYYVWSVEYCHRFDGARLDMFARKQSAYEAIPPTRPALFLSIPSVLPTRLGAFGVSLRCVIQKHKVLLTGDGHSKVMTCGPGVWQTFWTSTDFSWPSVDATQTWKVQMLWLWSHLRNAV